MDVSVLVSPAAGRGRAAAVAGVALDVLRAAGLAPRVLHATTRAAAEPEPAVDHRGADRDRVLGPGVAYRVGGQLHQCLGQPLAVGE
ncbi:sphingosine kinase, partial [Geodermatophilus sp. DF01-2]